MKRLARRVFGRYWRWQLALALAVGAIGDSVEPGGPTGSTFDIVVIVLLLAAGLGIAICGQRADARERS